MALARAHVWNAGDLLTAADLNGEFDNILNNPIALISPTTGPINFNLAAHTNLRPAAISATSGSTGQALVVSSSGGTIWGAPTVTTTQFTPTGSTGQVLAVTSSNSSPAFQVIPPDGGLSTTVPSTGMVYYISTAGPLVGLTIGSSGQVLTVSTALVPSWATPSASGGGGGTVFSTATVTAFDDFLSIITTGPSSNIFLTPTHQYAVTSSGTTLTLTPNVDTPGGVVNFAVNATGTVAAANNRAIFNIAKDPDMHQIWAASTIPVAAIFRIGITDGTFGTQPTNGLYFQTTQNSTGIVAVSRVGAAETIIVTTAVQSTQFQTFRIVVTGSGTVANVHTNGVLAGTFTSSALSTGAMTFSFGVDGAGATTVLMDAWSITQNRSSI